MLALIQRSSQRGAALLSIAGRPLIIRQVQWLRDLGVGRIAVEIGADEEGLALGRWLGERDATGVGVDLVLSGRRLTPKQIARRAGFPATEALLVIEGDVLGGGVTLAELVSHAGPSGARLHLMPPPGSTAPLRGGQLLVLPTIEASPRTTRKGPGWAMRVGGIAEAHALGMLALSAPSGPGASQLLHLHAAQKAPGLWIGRGAVIDPRARIVGPVLIGAGAVIRAGAEIGPGAFVGERAVVASGTTLAHGEIEDAVVTGEGLDLTGLSVSSAAIVDLRTAQRFPIDDPMLLAPRERTVVVDVPARLFALALGCALVPIVALCVLVLRLAGYPERGRRVLDLGRALVEVVTGTRALVGLAPLRGARPDGVSEALWRAVGGGVPAFFEVEAAPSGACPAAQLHARLWYAHEKRFALDLTLLARRVVARFASHPREEERVSPEVAEASSRPPPCAEHGRSRDALPGAALAPLEGRRTGGADGFDPAPRARLFRARDRRLMPRALPRNGTRLRRRSRREDSVRSEASDVLHRTGRHPGRRGARRARLALLLFLRLPRALRPQERDRSNAR